MLADEATGPSGGSARPLPEDPQRRPVPPLLPDRRERGRRQWREAGLRSMAYYHRDRPGRDGEAAVREHPAERAEPRTARDAPQPSRQSTCQ